ncbi:hypothetical protein J2Z32_003734 [Paenibacillus turicensis]|uniref:XkdX family protein n=1 Tax=Paenibacillus turicensis TaxID=160487 RepID=A0ABS4FWV8_9BACL|nr:hypothetical protein [Paenibacillus turicensis]
MFNTPLDMYQYFYDRKWITETQLRSCVALGEITASEFQVITGKPYK